MATAASLACYEKTEVYGLMAGGGCVSRTTGTIHGFPFRMLQVKYKTPKDEWIIYESSIVLNFLVFAAPTVLVLWYAQALRENHRELTGRCRECGYDLTGLPDLRCPECGSET